MITRLFSLTYTVGDVRLLLWLLWWWWWLMLVVVVVVVVVLGVVYDHKIVLTDLHGG